MIRWLVGSEPPPARGRFDVGPRRAGRAEREETQRRFDPSGYRTIVWDESGRAISVLVWR